MPAPKTTRPTRPAPRDHLPKKAEQEDERDTPLTFTDKDGNEWTSNITLAEGVTPGVMRKNRNNELMMFMELLENLFDDQPDAMAALDATWDTMNAAIDAVRDRMEAATGVSLGESSSSPT